MKNYAKLYAQCINFSKNDKTNVMIKFVKKIEGKLYELSIDNFQYYNYNDFFQYFRDNNKLKACLNNSGIKGDYSPENLKHCSQAYYFLDNETYSCITCLSSYILDDKTHLCQEKRLDSCTIENIGSEKIPEYKCAENKNGPSYTLVTFDNEEKEKVYIKQNDELSNCVEANANTEYIETKYNCTKCAFKYIPFYSKYYERMICQNLELEITKENKNYYTFSTQDKTKAIDGVCEKDYLFTPDGENCYKCDDESFGMPGCKGG